MTFVTPRFLREVIADKTGKKQQGIMVRIWASVLFYSVVGIIVGVVGTLALQHYVM